MGEAAELRLTQLHEGTPGLAWCRDRVVRRKSTSGASATGPFEPAGHLGAESPSRRTARPASARKQARLFRTGSEGCPRRTTWMRCPDTAVFRPSPPLVARSLTRLPICSGKSHPG